MRRGSAVLGVCMLAVLSLPTAVHAGPYDGPPSVHVDDPSAAPNQSLTITFAGFEPNEVIDVTNSCGGTTTVTADGSGAAAITVNAPNAEVTCTVTGVGRSSSRTDSASFSVLPIPLPATGTDSADTTTRAAQIVVAGAGLVAVSLVRRSRRRTSIA